MRTEIKNITQFYRNYQALFSRDFLYNKGSNLFTLFFFVGEMRGKKTKPFNIVVAIQLANGAKTI